MDIVVFLFAIVMLVLCMFVLYTFINTVYGAEMNKLFNQGELNCLIYQD